MSVTYKYGIDFGTTNSSISVVTYDAELGRNKAVVYDVEDFRSDDVDETTVLRETLRSVVSITHAGGNVQMDVGLAALANTKVSNNSPIKRIKMKLLNEYHCNDEVVLEKYKNIPNSDNYKASRVIAALLRHLKNKADSQLPQDVKPNGTVIGVPVNIYNDDQKNKQYKKVLYESLFIAGFYKDVIEAEEKTMFVDEPIAVAYSYAESKITKDKKILVFDFGGGTLDAAVVQMRAQSEEKTVSHEVLGKIGIPLGGEQLTFDFFDLSFLNKYGTRYEALKLFRQFGMPVTRATTSKEIWMYIENTEDKFIKFAGSRLFEKIDYLKCRLSKHKEVDFSFRFSEGDKNIVFNNVTFTKEDFGIVMNKYLPTIKKMLNKLFADNRIVHNEIDEVLLAGGSSIIPRVQELLFDYFGKSKVIFKAEDNIFRPNLNILTSIAKGLAVAGHVDRHGNRPISVDDIVMHDWGFKHGNKIQVIISKGTKIKDTAHGKLNINTGQYCDIRKSTPNTKSFYVDVMCDDIFRGSVEIKEATSNEYRLYYVIDPQKGWLILDVYITDSQQWVDDIPIENRKIDYTTYNGGN